MPKKKKESKEQTKVYLGRPKNNVAMGIVGMPNVGKSTLFNCLTGLNVAAENFSFCTIEPTDAKVPVPDARFDDLCQKYKPKNEIPAVLTVTDIAGLVRGASEGEGLGNEFLSNIQAVDGIYHVVRAFKGAQIEHVEGEVDPVRDLQIISDELLAKDLAKVEAATEVLRTTVRRGIDKSKKADKDLATAEKALACLQEGKDIREYPWVANDVAYLNTLQLLTAKPVVYLVNIRASEYAKKKNKWFRGIHEWVQDRSPGAPIIPFSAKVEDQLIDLTEAEKKEKLEELKCEASALPKIISTGYHALHLIHFFTVGEDEVRAWTVKEGTKAPKAAGTIHTDFEKKFVSASHFTYDDLAEHEDEAGVVAAGKKRTKGKDYVVQDGDIMHFAVGR